MDFSSLFANTEQLKTFGPLIDGFYTKNTSLSFYFYAFFLTWLPIFGIVIASLAGFLGYQIAIKPTADFGIIALFWFLATAFLCLSILLWPFLIIHSVILDWYVNNNILAFIVTIFGLISLIFIIKITWPTILNYLNDVFE